MFVSFKDVFNPPPEKIAHYIDMANKDIERMLKEHGETCITCAYYRTYDVNGYRMHEYCDKTKLVIDHPTKAVCCDYKFMGFFENKYKKSVDNEEEK